MTRPVTGPLGVRLPPDILQEASLTTNAFSARYGQALSGLINVVTKDGGEEMRGRVAYETDRPLWGGWDYGLDRLLLQADGPLFGKIGFLAAFDVTGRLDADPVNALRPRANRWPMAAIDPDGGTRRGSQKSWRREDCRCASA